MRTPADAPTEYYPLFDYLRLGLAVQVVAVHAGVAPTAFINPVPAFLAISGFVVLGSLGRNTYGQFFINRALRVLPALFASFAAIWLFFGYRPMVEHVLFWLWPFGPAPAINPVVWSLIYEEFFYTLLALMVACGLYRYRATAFLLGAACVASVATGSFFGIPPGFPMLGGAFFLGNVCYQHRHRIRLIPAWLATAAFVASMAWVFTLPYDDITRPKYAAADFLSFAAMLVFGIAGPKLPRLTVDLSYSVYLYHCIIRYTLMVFIPLGWTLFSFMLLSTIPIALASWYLIEKPALGARSWRPAFLVGRPLRQS